MLFSCIFHLFKDINEKMYMFYVKFDYIGVVVMISGSATSPIFYSLYCEEHYYLRLMFLGFIYTCSAITYIVLMTPKYCNNDDYIKLRGCLFVSCGLSCLVPVLYIELMLD